MRRVGIAMLLLALAAPTVAAQCLPAVVTPEQDRVLLPPGEETVLRVALENRNDEPARATLRVVAPPGWSAEPANPEPLLAPGVGTLTAVTLVAPERGTGVTRGEVRFEVVVSCEGSREEVASDAVVVVGVTPLAPGLVRWLAIAGALALGVLVAVRIASRLSGVRLHAAERERRVPAGEVTSFAVVVENRRAGGVEVTLAVGPLPAGWSAVAAAPEIVLEPREEKEVWIAVRAPVDAEPGARADVVVHAALKSDPRRASAVLLRARVPGP